jgi:hypothetical protein
MKPYNKLKNLNRICSAMIIVNNGFENGIFALNVKEKLAKRFE